MFIGKYILIFAKDGYLVDLGKISMVKHIKGWWNLLLLVNNTK